MILFEISSKNVDSKIYAIESYTFIKPRDNNRFLNFSSTYSKKLVDIDSRIFWNTSSYPFVLVCMGNNYLKILEVVKDLRKNTNDMVAESSTQVSLGYKGSDLIQDKKSVLITSCSF